MGSLLRYLTTAEGSDLILICNGEFFFVHRTIVAASSPVLRKAASGSVLFDGEAYMLNDVSPAALGKILAFIYKGDIPESYRKSNASNASAHLPLHQKFPITDKFLTTVKGKPMTVNLNDGTTKTTDTVTNKEKWAIMLGKQAALKDPYDMVSCKDYAEVISEVDLYVAAEKLEILALKEIAMRKVSAWFEIELETGLPLSGDFRTCAVFVLREHKEFAKSFIGVCARHLPVVEKDSALVSLIEELHPMTWSAMMSVRHQWTSQLKQTLLDREKIRDQLSALKTDNLQQKSLSEDREKVLMSQVERLSGSLALAESRAAAAKTTADQLENLNKSLHQELLDEKNSVAKMESANMALQENKSKRSDSMLQKLSQKVDDLERAVVSKEQALEQSRSANQKIKDDLRDANESLQAEIEMIKNAFDHFIGFVNYEPDCPRCRREWNLRIGHDRTHFTNLSLHVVESSFVFLAVMAEAENKPTSFSHFTASSPSAEEKTDLTELASQADALSADLNKQRQHCGHESTSTEISNAAEELKLLACELRSLDTAVNANKDLYTEAFDQDLAEIQGHLGGIFEDIADCCKEMQKANGPNTSAVGWLAKKRYVKKLQKHLEANKTTLIVMRTVLHHGKEYGMHNSPGRLAESSPHTMQEDLAILETVFASRHAIKDLHNLDRTSHEHSSSTSSAGTVDTPPSFKPGAHGRNLSSATGVDISVVEDVLPTSNKKKKQDALARRFSRRGVRLAVHSSIMDTNAHDVPISLRKKWIYQAQLRRTPEYFNAGSPSIAQLSKISEVNSSSGPDEVAPAPSRHRSLTTPENLNANQSPERSDSQASSVSDRLSKARQRSSSLVSSPVGRKLGNLINRLSRSNLRERRLNHKGSPHSIEQQIHPSSEANTHRDPEKRERGAAAKEMSAKEKPGWSYRFTRPFVKEELTTPDFEKGF